MATIGVRKYYSSGSASQIFSDFQSFLLAVGWEIHDSYVSGSDPYRVFKSNGEAGIYPYIYLQLRFAGTVAIYGHLYLYWNSLTHTGLVPTRTSNGVSVTSAEYIHFCGNKNLIGITREGGAGFIAGFPNKLFIPEITNLTYEASMEEGAVLEVVSSVGFKKGQNLQIVGINGEGRDELSVVEVPDSTHIKVGFLPRSYASGAFLGSNPCPAFQGSLGSNDLLPLCPKGFSGLINSTGSAHDFRSDSTIHLTSIDPDRAINLYGLVPWTITHYVGGGQIQGTIGYVDEDFLFSPAVIRNDIFMLNDGIPEFGMMTSFSASPANTFTDSQKNWTPDQWAGKMLVIVDGGASGTSRLIASNTATTLTLETAFVSTKMPNGVSAYRIVDKIYRYVANNCCFLETCQTLP